MPFIPHTDEDVRQMLAAIGVSRIEDLFDEIPAALRTGELKHTPEGRNEMEMLALLSARAKQDEIDLCFIGAGCYDHHIPAAVWDLAQRGEYLTAYTPYQAEASQGTLQLIYEYQSMMASLTGMDVSNASVYDGASGLGEAVLMAVRANRKAKSKRVLVPRTVHPHYRAVARTVVGNQGLELVDVPFAPETGLTDVDALTAAAGDEGVAAVVIPQPNFLGGLEDVDALVDRAHALGALAVAVVNPTSLALLRPPGEWGEQGADIVIGEGQPLGIPLSAGGPYFGFLCTRKAMARQMPGRVVGRTTDADGHTGYVMTLRAREQDIRRSKATSNICTNQGLMVTAATIYMALMGAEGLERVARHSHAGAVALRSALAGIQGVEPLFDGPIFHEFAVRIDGPPVAEILDALAGRGILGGYALESAYPEVGNSLLLCSTELHTEGDRAAYVEALAEILAGGR
jgi:glycine dehydrogenase subunit 1